MTEFVAKLRVRLESVARKTLKNILLNHINLILKNFIVLLRIKKPLLVTSEMRKITLWVLV